jgi:mono/diheme cytochrome c family protein
MDETGNLLEGFPVEVNPELVQLGQERFGIYCTPCHGISGEGNGKATQFGFPKPPSLIDAAAKQLTTGQIFDVITHGKGKMFPYAYRVKPNERWAVIAYLRAMQLKNGQVKPQDLTPAELDQIGSQP